MAAIHPVPDHGDPGLAFVGAVAARLDPDRLHDSLDAVLDLLRTRFEADACEIFLSDPAGSAALLANVRGADLGAFCSRVRFDRDQGFPGLVLAEGVPLAVQDLPHDPRYLRERVKASGYQAYACAPIGRRRVRGTIHLAWKRQGAPVQEALDVLQQVNRPIATTLRAVRGELRATPRGWHSEGPDAVARGFRSVGEANGATFLIVDRRGRRLQVAASAGVSPVDRADAVRRLEDCPALRSGEPQVLGEGAPCTGTCRGRCGAPSGTYCIPVAWQGQQQGLVVLTWGDTPPLPPTSHLEPVLELADGLARSTDQSTPRWATRAAMLQVRCFGGLQVRLADRRLESGDFGRSKARELLALLVARRGRPLTADALVERLWPDAALDAGRPRLHVTLNALRKAIEPSSGRPWTYVLCADGTWHLDPSASIDVDLWRFQDRLRRARSAEAGMRPIEEVASLLVDAIDLYRGDLFEGLADAPWARRVQDRWRDEMLDACAHLARLAQDLADAPLAVRALRRAVAIDPIREDLQRELMHLLAAVGRRREAIDRYERLRRRLAEDLDSQPQPPTRRLHERLQGGF